MQRPHFQTTAPKGVDAIAKTMLLPHDRAPMRLPTFPNLERTAVCNFEVNLSTNSSTFGHSTLLGTLSRNAACPLWLEKKLPSTDEGRASATYILETPYAGTDHHALEHPYIYATGDFVPIGWDGQQEWVYMPLNKTNGTQGMGIWNYASNTIVADMTTLDRNGVYRTHKLSLTSGANVLASTYFTDVWMCFNTLTIPPDTPASRIAVYPLPNVTLLLPAYRPPEADVSSAPYTNSRVTSLACLASNVSRVQVKQGTVTAARLSAEGKAFWSVSEEDFTSVHPADRYYGPSENGLYVVAPPTQESEVLRDQARKKFRVIAMSATGFTVEGEHYSPVVDPDTDAPFMAFMFQEETGIDETLLAITTDIHIEFRTSSPLFQVGISCVPLEQYHAAQLVVAQTGYFFENPTHWADLALSIARIATRVIPLVMPNTRIATVARAAAMLLPRKPPPRPMIQKQMVRPQRAQGQARKRTTSRGRKSRVRRGRNKA